MSTIFNRIDLAVKEDQVTCQPHNLETCSTCDLDFTALNQLTKNLNSIKGNIPPPNVANQQLSMQIGRLKEEGNKNFHLKKYAEAIKLYSLAVDMAFQRSVWEPHALAKEELSVCLSNRAAAYLALEAWVDAYVDALSVVKAKRDWSKGYFRMGKALVGLKRFEEALEAFKLGLGFDPKSEELKTAYTETKVLIGNPPKD